MHVYSVGELTGNIKNILEGEFALIYLSGEISNLRTPGSGHKYFVLKDHKAQIKAVIFRSCAAKLPFRPADGQQVIAMGRVSVYEPRGDYQLIVDKMEPAGIGALALRFLQLKEQLRAEGLFAEERKAPLPTFARSIGVITSATGAAVKDIITVAQRRYPGIKIVLYPVLVQGESAAPQIAKAIASMQRADIDVLIVGRGGGSIEDLWAFNEEVVARAVAASKIPVVSAVGHETDFTICDFVADLRAPTPSAAAEIVVPDIDKLQQNLRYYQQKMTTLLHNQLERVAQVTDHLSERLELSMQNQLVRQQARLRGQYQQLVSASPLVRIQATRVENSHQRRILIATMGDHLQQKSHRLELLLAKLREQDPGRALQKGYAVVSEPRSGRAITRAAKLRCQQEVELAFADGRVRAQITKIELDPADH